MLATIIFTYNYNAAIAQLVEQLICNHQARGSNPLCGTTFHKNHIYNILASEAFKNV